MNIAIIGYGSIGQRHEKNCLSLGHSVDVLSRHVGRKLKKGNYDLVVICSKTSEHLSNVKRFNLLSQNFLIEKPLAATYKDALAIKKILAGKKVRVGYCLIFNPIIKKIKQIIDESNLGNIFFAQLYAGSYLPNWRKGEDYRKRYSAKRDEGGGVALDLIHEINYAQYLFPDKLNSVYSYLAKISNLEITSDDLAHFALIQTDRLITITLNYFQLFPERYIRIIGSQGTLFADLVDKRIEVYDQDNKPRYKRQFDFDYNQMYIDEIKSMERFIKGSEPQADILSIDQAIGDLRVVEGKPL